jgi:DNA polymerase-3 subunit gamma/tau
MLARVLVPSSDDSERGALARVERLERRVGVTDAATDAGGPASGGRGGASAEPTAPARAVSAPAPAAPARAAPAPAEAARGAGGGTGEPPAGDEQLTPVAERTQGSARSKPAASAAQPEAPTSPAPTPAASEPAAAPKPVGPVTLQQMRDAWPEVLASLQRTKRSAWMVAFTAQVREFRDGEVLVLAFPSEQDVAGFRGGAPGQSVSELLRSAIAEVLGVTVKFIAKVEGSAARGDGGARGGSDAATSDEGGAGSVPVPAETAPVASPSRSEAPAASPSAASGDAPAPGSVGSKQASSSAKRSATTAATNGTAPKASAASARKTAAGSTPTASAASAPKASAATAPTGAVDSWATITIPTEPEPDVQAATSVAGSARPTATALAEAPAAASVAIDDLPDDADAPPDDVEPPFDPGPVPELVVEAPAPSPAPRGSAAAPADGGIQRYGESVVREVLGATFLEEVEAPGRPGFGERG